jgi:energy-coupling factor transporter ATP-binding protein EcfA2
MATSSSKKTSKPKDFDPREPLPADAPYFYSLTLENIRCFAGEQTLDLSDRNGNAARWTVILGENGTGKTTLLQALAMMEPVYLGSDEESLRHYGSKYGESNLWQKKILRSDAIMYRLLHPKRNIISCKIKINDKEVDGLSFNVYYKPGITLNSIPISEKKWTDNFFIFGYGAKRHIGTTPWEEYRATDTTQSLFESKSELINVAEWLRNVKLAASMSPQSSIFPERFKKVESLLTSGLLPEVDAVRLAAVGGGISGVEVTFHTPDGWIPLESLGLGYQTMIAWTVDFAARMVERYPDSPQPLHEPAIVLVDELDLHLHPRWQREIIGFLTKQFPKTQFIVTAHSPLVVQAAQDVDANIVLLRRVGDHVKIDQNVRIDRNLTVDLLLTSDAFGLEALYSPRTEELMREQELLQAKSHLKATEQERLKQIEQEIGLIPITSNPIDNEAMTLIREAAELLKAKNKEKVAKPRSTQTTKSITLKVKSAGSGDKTPSTQTTKSKKKHNVHGTHS